MPILECVGLERYFGSLKAISDLSFSVEKGEIFGVVRPNGSGKTTLFNLITKVLPPTAGTINSMGRRIDELKSHQINHLGTTTAADYASPSCTCCHFANMQDPASP